jgi:hypothetical protein
MEDVASYDREPRPPFKLDIGRIGMIIVLPVILWAFYTTSSGMADIMRKGAEDHIGLIGAFVGSAAVLALLALTSWSLGSDIAALLTRQVGLAGPPIGKVILIGLVFVFVFGVSAFFSFTYYYNNIRGLSTAAISNEQMPSELMNEIITPLEKRVRSVYEAESTRAAGSPGMVTYFGQLDAILKVAGNGGENFREQVRAAQAAQAKANADLARDAEGRRKDIVEAKRQLVELQGKISSLDRDISDLNQIINPKQAELDELATTIKLESQAMIDAEKGLDKLGTGCGKNCQSHMALRDKARLREKTIKETLVAPLKDREAKVMQRGKLSEGLAPLKAKTEQVVEGGPKSSSAPALEIAADAAATLREFSEARDRVRLDPTWEKVRKVKASCEVILKIERQLKMTPSEIPADFACEPLSTDARELLTARDEVIKGLSVFDRDCTLRGNIAKTISKITDSASADPKYDGLAEAKKPIDACIYAARDAGLAEADIQAFVRHSNEFSRDNNARLNKFARARIAFTSGTSDSTLAIAVAVIQDAFILILKLLSDIFGREVRPRKRDEAGAPIDVSDNDLESPEIRAAKAVLRHAQPVRSNTSELTVASTADLPPEVRDNLKALVNRFVRQGGAHVDRKGNYYIENASVHEIETEVRNLSLASRSSDMAPRPVAPAPRRAMRPDVPSPEATIEQVAPPQDTATPSRSVPRRGPSALVREYLSSNSVASKSQPGLRNARGAASPFREEAASNSASPEDEQTGEIRFDRLRARRQNTPES